MDLALNAPKPRALRALTANFSFADELDVKVMERTPGPCTGEVLTFTYLPRLFNR